MDNRIVNYFTGGMSRRAIPQSSDPSKYLWALNAVPGNRKNKGFGLVNEESVKEVSALTGVVGAVYVETRDWMVFLFDTSEVGYVDAKTDKYKTIGFLNLLRKDAKTCGVVRSTGGEIGCDLNFSKCQWINIDYNFWNNCSELHIMFSLNCELYTVNLDMLADKDRSAMMTCSDIKTFRCDCVPTVRAIGVDGGGVNLKNGSYSFFCRLFDKDGHKTNFFNIGNAVSIGGGRNTPEETSKEYIQVNIENINCNYGTLQLGVIKNIGGAEQAFLIEKIHYTSNGINYEYRGDNGREIPISLDDVTAKKVNYLQARLNRQHMSRMIYGQIRNHKNLDGQKYANQARVLLPIYRVPSKIAHKYSGLQPLERYIIAIVYQYCDGTESAAFPITNGGAQLEQRTGGGGGGGEHITDGRDEDFDGTDLPPYVPDGEGEESGGGAVVNQTGGGTGSVEVDNSEVDDYLDYDQLPKDHHRVQNDSYYTDGCVTNNGDCEDFGKAYADGIDASADELPEDGDDGMDCLECGQEPARASKNAVAKYLSAFLFGPGALFGGISIGANRNRKNKKAASSANGIKDTAQKQLDELKKEEVWVPKRTKVKVTNNKTGVSSGSQAPYNPDGEFGDLYDGMNISFVNYLDPKWVSSRDLYPMTENCSGGYIFGNIAGSPIQLMEIPLIRYFDSNVVGVKSAMTFGVDETEGYVYMIGLKVENIVIPTIEETGKPLCPNQPYKIVYIPRDPLNSRVVASGLLLPTFAGQANGSRPHAVPCHGLSSQEYLDRYIQRGGDDHDHEGAAHARNLYVFYSPDTMLGKVPLVANKFVNSFDLRGDGWRHGLYAESTEDKNFWGRNIDQRGTRQSVNLHSATPKNITSEVLGITYVKADSIQEPPPGIDLPLLNLGRESCVYLQLGGTGGTHILPDKSFIADGLDHSYPVVDARGAYGHLIRDMDRQYGSLVNATYKSIGLFAKGQSNSVEGLVGDSHVGSFNFRRSSYVSNRVGDRTFIPSPRHYSGIARFFGFGDPTELPDSGDERDPKNMANRYPPGTKGDAAAAAGHGAGSVYYAGTLKTLVFFFCQSRVNAYYRQRGGEGEVHARNLGTMALDSAVPMGGKWENSWLNRGYREVVRESKFHSLIRPMLRIGAIVGIPLFVLVKSFALNSLFDIPMVIVRVALVIIFTLIAIWIFTPSRINRMLGLKAQLNDREGGATDESLRQWVEDNYLEYSSSYNESSSIAPSIGMSDPYNVCDCDDCSETTYFRPGGIPSKGINNLLYYSAVQRQNTEINAYRNVLFGDYSEMRTDAGQIQDIFTLNNNLYVQTTDGYYQLQHDRNVDYKDIEHLLGNGRALGSPMRFFDGVSQGYAGTTDPNASIICPYGHVSIDAQNNSINLFTGGGIENITLPEADMFRSAMEFCGSYSCRDQKISGSWFSMGYDPVYDRLLVTKKDEGGCGSWTMSYDLLEKKWISEHSYIPNFYMWTRKKFYSVYDNKLWLHNDNPGNRQNFYGTYYPFKVVFDSSMIELDTKFCAPFQFKTVEIHTEANVYQGKDILRNQDKFFTMGAWWTTQQTTGKLVLDHKNYQCQRGQYRTIRDLNQFVEMQRSTFGPWKMNKLVDKTKNITDPMEEYPCECGFAIEPTDNADCKSQSGKNSPMADYYLRQMLVLDDEELNNVEMKLLRVITFGSKREI